MTVQSRLGIHCFPINEMLCVVQDCPGGFLIEKGYEAETTRHECVFYFAEFFEIGFERVYVVEVRVDKMKGRETYRVLFWWRGRR